MSFEADSERCTAPVERTNVVRFPAPRPGTISSGFVSKLRQYGASSRLLRALHGDVEAAASATDQEVLPETGAQPTSQDSQLNPQDSAVRGVVNVVYDVPDSGPILPTSKDLIAGVAKLAGNLPQAILSDFRWNSKADSLLFALSADQIPKLDPELLARLMEHEPKNVLVVRTGVISADVQIARLTRPGWNMLRARDDDEFIVLRDISEADELRTRADAGDDYAAYRLVNILAEHGHTDELRARADAGDDYAAYRLVNILAEHGHTDELRARADAGDDYAAYRCSAGTSPTP
ncbi:hypothetical protein [Actinoplanes cyaneus]|nr:hypothetical protein [Actinoplanes cyaneus]